MIDGKQMCGGEERRGEERNKIKRKGNEGGLGGEKNFGRFLSSHFWKSCYVYFFKRFFFFFFWLGLPGTTNLQRRSAPVWTIFIQTSYKKIAKNKIKIQKKKHIHTQN
jgi:hypothetical protein